MNRLPFELDTSNDLLTSRAGLFIHRRVDEAVGFLQPCRSALPMHGSNLGFKLSVFVNSMLLILHDGGERLDDLRRL